MSRAGLGGVCLLLAAGTMCAAVGRAQGLPKPSPTAKACAYLPVAELEAHFGAKAQNLGGMDQTTQNWCAATFPDRRRTARIEARPPSAADQGMSAAQRLAVIKGMPETISTRDFGAIGCFRAKVNIGEPAVSTVCFLAKAQYLALAVQSVDEAHTTYDAVKALLEKAAARRK